MCRKIIPGFILVLLLLCAGGRQAIAQQVAVKTNALMWGAMTPNLGVEVVTGEHTSVHFSAFGNKNPYGQTMQIIGLQPQFRYWFNGRPMTREFIGAGALVTTYDINWRNNVYDGGAVGLEQKQ